MRIELQLKEPKESCAKRGNYRSKYVYMSEEICFPQHLSFSVVHFDGYKFKQTSSENKFH